MLERASGQFTIEGNVEDIFGGISGAARIARISQTCLFTGPLEGESIAEYTAVLPREGAGSFQGFQRISGAIGEREGTFVVCVSGDYVKGQSRGTWSIVPKSGSGDFIHIRGGGSFSQSAGKPGTYKLEFDLRKPRKARDASATESGADELIPGIDIVADEELTPAVEPLVSDASTEPPAMKPARASRKRTKPPEPAMAEPVAVPIEPPPAPKRSRRKSTPVVTEVVSEPLPVGPKPTRKRTRTMEPPAPVVDSPVAVEPAAKRRRSTRTPAVEVVTAEATPVVETPRKRVRKAPAQNPEPVEPDSAPVAEPKPTRGRNPVSPRPVPLPIAQEKSARQRKSKAA